MPSLQPMYELLPAFIRLKDAQGSGALRELVDIFEQQAGALRADLARMYDGWFIETCDEWLIPYIGELVAAPPVVATPAMLEGERELRVRGVLSPRRATANAIAHGRRKGTIWILEELAADLAHWPARAVEFYRRLAITAHLDHLHSGQAALADLRGGVRHLDAAAPFEIGTRLADVRRISSEDSPGGCNIANVGLFVWRERRYPVTATAAYRREDVGRHCFTFSALGIDTQVVRRPVPEVERSSLAARENLPLPLSRWALEWNPDAAATSASADPALYGPERSLFIDVLDWPRGGARGVTAAQVIPADLSDWAYKVPRDHVAVDPSLGRIAFNPSQAPRQEVRVSYGYGFAADLGGGQYAREDAPMPREFLTLRVWSREDRPNGKDDFGSIRAALAEYRLRRQAADGKTRPPSALRIELMESGIYAGRFDVEARKGETIAIVAAPMTRPVIWLPDESSGRVDAIDIRGAAHSRVVLEGLLIAGRAVEAGELRQERSEEGEGAQTAGFCELLIRHSTLVPGSSLQPNCEPRRPAEPSLVLRDTGVHLRVESSIVGAIVVISEEARGTHGRISICDSAVDATSETRAAIGAPGGRLARTELSVWRSTLIGTVGVHELRSAEDSIFDGIVTVARRQTGCLRFCYLRSPSRTPRRYRCQPPGDAEAGNQGVAPRFASLRYGTSNYLRLLDGVSPLIASGAHDGAEMGMYHDLFEPQRLTLLRDRLQEFVPASGNAAVIFVT
jgi:hypothetical protein